MFTWPCGDFRVSAIHPGCCTRARILLRCETVSCKHKMTTGFSVKSVCQWAGTGSTCVMFAILIARVFYQHEVYLQITERWNNPSSCKHDIKSKSHSCMKLVPVRDFSKYSDHAWTSVILARKHDNHCHSTTSLSKNIMVAETSFLMLEVSAFCSQGRA